LDDNWERAIPFFNIQKSELTEICNRYDAGLRINSYKALRTGCRNSNYAVKTNKGDYFLRIFPPGDSAYLNEKTVNKILLDKINIPRLYFASEFKNRGCLIYGYIDSVPLQSRLADKARLKDDIVRQAAKSAAVIHGFKGDDFPGLTKNGYPPYAEWYELFLSNVKAVSRLGHETVKRVRRLVAENGPKLREIDKHQSFTHGDFRPANMLLDDKNTVYIADWEFAGEGHTLGDIGQFFRYRRYFDDNHLSVFKEEYDKHARVRLPGDWYALSRLRDLVNPLQMIGGDTERPLMFQDLKNVVLDSLEYFGY
jgi:thiamine kinase-like enzyme